MSAMIIGKKLGMTQVFSQDGTATPVTIVQAAPGTVLAVKTAKRDGYEAEAVAFFPDENEKHYNKPMLGVFKKAGVKPHRVVRELPVSGRAVGDQVTVEAFAAGDMVAVSGTSKGKGFQGAMKRHNFRGGASAHGSMFNRAVGSIGASSYPSRVFKGQRMPGHMGAVRATVRNMKIVEVRAEQNLILLKGAVPGHRNAVVEIRKES